MSKTLLKRCKDTVYFPYGTRRHSLFGEERRSTRPRMEAAGAHKYYDRKNGDYDRIFCRSPRFYSQPTYGIPASGTKERVSLRRACE